MSVGDIERIIDKTKSRIFALKSKLLFYEEKLVREKKRALYLAQHPAGQPTRGSSHWNRWIKKHSLENVFEVK